MAKVYVTYQKVHFAHYEVNLDEFEIDQNNLLEVHKLLIDIENDPESFANSSGIDINDTFDIQNVKLEGGKIKE